MGSRMYASVTADAKRDEFGDLPDDGDDGLVVISERFKRESKEAG
jgi:hypothetical protein